MQIPLRSRKGAAKRSSPLKSRVIERSVWRGIDVGLPTLPRAPDPPHLDDFEAASLVVFIRIFGTSWATAGPTWCSLRR